jgi:hypothetical protein
MWLVQGCQRCEVVQLREDRAIDDHRRRKSLSSMHNPMAQRDNAQVM